MVTIVDSHCHLNFSNFDEDRDSIIQHAREQGVSVMQTICTHMAEADEVRLIAEKYEGVYASVGVHPCHVHEAPLVEKDDLMQRAESPHVIGIGETGLDYFHDDSHKEVQHISFRRHIAVSRALQMPIIIHSRSADDDTIAIVKEELSDGYFPALIHCFSSGVAMAKSCLELGLSLSFSGIVTFKNAHEVHEAARLCPLDQMLVETDAPYLAPMPYRGKRNQPAYTRHTAEHIATLKGFTLEEVAEQTTANFFSLFAKANPYV